MSTLADSNDGDPDWGSSIHSDRLLPSWRAIPVLVGVWLLPALLFSSRRLAQGEVDLMTWASGMGKTLWYWLFWASVTPAIYRIYVRLPLVREQIRQVLPLHLLAAIGVTFLAAIATAVVRMLGGDQLRDAFAHALFSPAARGPHLLHFGMYFLTLAAVALVYESRLRRRIQRNADAARLHAGRLEAQLAAAKLNSLRGRLQPHFLFNALNSVGALVESGENERAFRMIGTLGGLLRQTLKPIHSQLIPLAEEMDIVRRYLAVESLRFGDRLILTLEIPNESVTLRVPPLILQPLVENTIQHAVARVTRPVHLTVRAVLGPKSLCLEVLDDGPGLPADWQLGRDAGIGLDTTAKRLRLLFGDAATFRVEPAGNGGIHSRIEIPLRPALSEDEASNDEMSSHEPRH